MQIVYFSFFSEDSTEYHRKEKDCEEEIEELLRNKMCPKDALVWDIARSLEFLD